MHQTARDLALKMREECLGSRVDRLHRVVSRSFDQALRPLGLSMPQLELLAVLTVRGSVRQSELARVLAVDRSTISRNIAVLERDELVETELSASGRIARVAISEQGTAALAGADQAWTEAQQEIRARLGEDSPATLDAWLREIRPSPRDV